MNHVFLSYRHESDAHGAQVRRLGEKLQNCGLPVALDQFFVEKSPGGPDEGWVKWCENYAEQSACVLVICSKGWFDSYRGNGAANEGLGAATEASIFSQDIYDEKGHNSRIRLVNLGAFKKQDIPRRLRPWHIFEPFASQVQFDQMAAWIRQRLAMPSSSATQSGKVVYLTPCKFDLRQERANLCSYLQEKQWQVRPDPTHGARPLDDDLRESLAFVQLLESYAREDSSDHTQLARAKELAMPLFRFRHSKIQLAELEDAHRAFVTEPGIVTVSFDDFKASLLVDLDAICNQKHATLPYASRNLLVRVVIRASQTEQLWEHVFAAVDAEPDMRAALLEGGESFKDKHDPAVPCHGFLIVCDAEAQAGGAVSTKADLEQCMQIQVGEKNEARRPPVGLLYWPPPAPPPWSRLARVMPPKMHRMVADASAALQPFFQEVRRVAL